MDEIAERLSSENQEIHRLKASVARRKTKIAQRRASRAPSGMAGADLASTLAAVRAEELSLVQEELAERDEELRLAAEVGQMLVQKLETQDRALREAQAAQAASDEGLKEARMEMEALYSRNRALDEKLSRMTRSHVELASSTMEGERRDQRLAEAEREAAAQAEMRARLETRLEELLERCAALEHELEGHQLEAAAAERRAAEIRRSSRARRASVTEIAAQRARAASGARSRAPSAADDASGEVEEARAQLAAAAQRADELDEQRRAAEARAAALEAEAAALRSADADKDALIASLRHSVSDLRERAASHARKPATGSPGSDGGELHAAMLESKLSQAREDNRALRRSVAQLSQAREGAPDALRAVEELGAACQAAIDGRAAGRRLEAVASACAQWLEADSEEQADPFAQCMRLSCALCQLALLLEMGSRQSSVDVGGAGADAGRGRPRAMTQDVLPRLDVFYGRVLDRLVTEWTQVLRLTACLAQGGGALGRPLWESDDERADCGLCHKPFWLFRRRHHCRSCGCVVCYDCCWRNFDFGCVSSSSGSSEGGITPAPHKVCEVCWGVLKMVA